MKKYEYGLVLTETRRYKLVKLNEPKPVSSFKYREVQHTVDRTKGRVLKGWRPLRPQTWLSDILDNDGVVRRLYFYQEAIPEALDRLVEPYPVDRMPATVFKAWMLSGLYRRRMAKARIGGANLRLILFLLGAVVIILAIMIFSGYLG